MRGGISRIAQACPVRLDGAEDQGEVGGLGSVAHEPQVGDLVVGQWDEPIVGDARPRAPSRRTGEPSPGLLRPSQDFRQLLLHVPVRRL